MTVTVHLLEDDALLLRGTLMHHCIDFQAAGNEVMVGMLDRVVAAIQAAEDEGHATRSPRPNAWERLIDQEG